MEFHPMPKTTMRANARPLPKVTNRRAVSSAASSPPALAAQPRTPRSREITGPAGMNALRIIEENLDEDLERLAQDPASVEARESVAEWQRLRTNLLQAGPSGVRFPRRRRGESRRMQLFKDTLVALMVGGAWEAVRSHASAPGPY